MSLQLPAAEPAGLAHSHPLDAGSGWFQGIDQAMAIAQDLPSHDMLPALADPARDHEDQDLRDRREDVESKHKKLNEWFDATGYEAVVLGRADSLAWFTSGGDLGQSMTGECGSVLLFVNRTARAIICDNVQSARVFEEELAGLGFQLKERDWFNDPRTFAAELGHGKKVATDLGLYGWPNELGRLRSLRLSLTKLERQRYRELGRMLAREVEATARNFARGENEADVAGHLAHRLVRQGVVPVDLRVAGDDRLIRFRQPTFKKSKIERCAVITCTGRRHGLNASLTRIVSFGPAPEALQKAHSIAAMVDASAIFFSRPALPVVEVFKKIRRIYEKFGHGPEWMKDYQGVVAGYQPRELMLMPESAWTLPDNVALSWSGSVGPARSQDTIVIDERGFEVVTDAQRWPKLDVTVKGFQLKRPGILER